MYNFIFWEVENLNSKLYMAPLQSITFQSMFLVMNCARIHMQYTQTSGTTHTIFYLILKRRIDKFNTPFLREHDKRNFCKNDIMSLLNS